MNQKNFDYLKDQVKYTGFGEALENELKEKMQKQTPEFQLYYQTRYGNDIAVATLNFKKSGQSDHYFFNNYKLILNQENSPQMTGQTFHIHKENNITLKEAYNLLSGRSVHKELTNKEGAQYSAWMQMDFRETDKNGNYPIKHYYQNYGFNLEMELAKYPIRELANEQDKTRLMESLQKGNRLAVTFMKDGNEQKMFLEANPKFKLLNVYDSAMQRVLSQSQSEKNTHRPSIKQETKKTNQSQGNNDGDVTSRASQKRTKRNQQSIS